MNRLSYFGPGFLSRPIPAIAQDDIGAQRDTPPPPPEIMKVLMLCMSRVSLRHSINSTRARGMCLASLLPFSTSEKIIQGCQRRTVLLVLMWSGNFHTTLFLVCLSLPLSVPLPLMCG